MVIVADLRNRNVAINPLVNRRRSFGILAAHLGALSHTYLLWKFKTPDAFSRRFANVVTVGAFQLVMRQSFNTQALVLRRKRRLSPNTTDVLDLADMST